CEECTDELHQVACDHDQTNRQTKDQLASFLLWDCQAILNMIILRSAPIFLWGELSHTTGRRTAEYSDTVWKRSIMPVFGTVETPLHFFLICVTVQQIRKRF